MNLKPKFWSADKIVSFSAILISLATMTIYLYQTHLIQKQQHASVMPYVRMWYSYDEDRFEMMVSNEGLGPAFIEKVNIYDKEKQFQNMDIPSYFQSEYLKKDTIYMTFSNIGEGMLFASGKDITIISKLKDKKDTDKLKKIFFNEKLEMEIIYTSIYGEKWKVRGAFTRPEKIDD
jgi:hypothetical protein